MTRARDVANIDGLLTTTGDTYYASAAGTPARLGIGTTDQVLKVTAGVPAWSTPAASTPTFVGCSIYQAGAGQTPANATETLLTFDAEFFDTNGFHSTSTNTERITIPTGYAGKYLITLVNRWNANATGERNMYIKVNNATTIEAGSGFGSSANTIMLSRSVILNLSVGDYLTFSAQQTSGGNLALYMRANEVPIQVQWLGA